MEIEFTKMHGAGNDYIYVNTLRYPIDNPEELSVEWSRYHTGIGSDGLVLICPSDQADFKMRIFNADGSEARMCGNASRCIGKYLYEEGLTNKTDIQLETLSGIKILHLHLNDKNTVESVTVDMGIPTDIHEVALGEGYPLFPDRVNVEFVQVLTDSKVRMRVWERGSGITQACGTGACATAVASAFTDRCGRKSSIVMDGGTLEIEWAGDNHIYMTGPATKVFDGKIEI